MVGKKLEDMTKYSEQLSFLLNSYQNDASQRAEQEWMDSIESMVRMTADLSLFMDNPLMVERELLDQLHRSSAISQKFLELKRRIDL